MSSLTSSTILFSNKVISEFGFSMSVDLIYSSNLSAIISSLSSVKSIVIKFKSKDSSNDLFILLSSNQVWINLSFINWFFLSSVTTPDLKASLNVIFGRKYLINFLNTDIYYFYNTLKEFQYC